MRAIIPLCLAALAITSVEVGAQSRRSREMPVIVVKKRSFLDAGTAVSNGRETNYVRNIGAPGGLIPPGHIGGRAPWIVQP